MRNLHSSPTTPTKLDMFDADEHYDEEALSAMETQFARAMAMNKQIRTKKLKRSLARQRAQGKRRVKARKTTTTTPSSTTTTTDPSTMTTNSVVPRPARNEGDDLLLCTFGPFSLKKNL